MARFVKAAKTSEISQDSCKLVALEDNRIAVFNLSGDYYAIDNACTHEGGPLSKGVIDGEEVQCPWHYSRFNIKTGQCTRPPAELEGGFPVNPRAIKPVRTYNVRVNGDDIEVEI